jgi:hypothetical protein
MQINDNMLSFKLYSHITQPRFLTTKVTAFDSSFLASNNTGLGNVLFQISSVYGLAKDMNMIPEFTRVKEFGEKLKNRYGSDHSNTIYRNLLSVKDVNYNEIYLGSKVHEVPDEIIKLKNSKSGNYTIIGYLQWAPYFNKYRDDILHMFSPDECSLQYIKIKYPILFDTSQTCISIHVRFEGNSALDTIYYSRAIQYILDSGSKSPHFLIFSDQPYNAVKLLSESLTSREYTVVEGNPDYIDLWTTSLCKHNIISHSTFSWWGAYLNASSDKIVTYPESFLNVMNVHEGVSYDSNKQHLLDWSCINDSN